MQTGGGFRRLSEGLWPESSEHPPEGWGSPTVREALPRPKRIAENVSAPPKLTLIPMFYIPNQPVRATRRVLERMTCQS